MSFQIIIVVEADEKSRTDYTYINRLMEKCFNVSKRIDIKRSPVFMGGKGNYNKKKVTDKIKQYVKQYEYNGESQVIYCFDTDNFDTNHDVKKLLETYKTYCKEHEYEFVWFCHDIEEVFCGKSVKNTEKVTTANNFEKNGEIEKCNLDSFEATTMNKGKSNLLLVLKKYLE